MWTMSSNDEPQSELTGLVARGPGYGYSLDHQSNFRRGTCSTHSRGGRQRRDSDCALELMVAKMHVEIWDAIVFLATPPYPRD